MTVEIWLNTLIIQLSLNFVKEARKKLKVKSFFMFMAFTLKAFFNILFLLRFFFQQSSMQSKSSRSRILTEFYMHKRNLRVHETNW